MKNQFAVPSDYYDRHVCVLGLGFVGLTLAVTLANCGFCVTGVEARSELLQQIGLGNPHFFEPGLATGLRNALESQSLTLHPSIPEDSRATVFIITVGTPLDDHRKADLTSLRSVSNAMEPHIRPDSLVILRSTVPLGATRSVVLPILETGGKVVQTAFCPERTVEGRAMEELRYLPQIIGANSPAVETRAAQFFQFITPTIVRVSDLETAELVKLIDNTKRDLLFSFSNEIASLCDAMGLNAHEAISAGRFDYSRTDIPSPGPVGGPCLSKDSYILAQSMETHGVTPRLALAARTINEQQLCQSAQFIRKLALQQNGFPESPIISLLGLAFKGRPATDDFRGTPAAQVFEELRRLFPSAKFRGFDPVAKPEAIRQFGLHPHPCAQGILKGAHIALILNNHPFFSTMPMEEWTLAMARPGLVYDFWNHFGQTPLSLPPGIQYISLGKHRDAI